MLWSLGLLSRALLLFSLVGGLVSSGEMLH